MCGRYASAKDPDALVEEFEVDESLVEQPLKPDYNVAPTKPVYAVVTRGLGEAPEGDRHPTSNGSSVWCGGGWCRPGRRTRRSALA